MNESLIGSSGSAKMIVINISDGRVTVLDEQSQAGDISDFSGQLEGLNKEREMSEPREKRPNRVLVAIADKRLHIADDSLSATLGADKLITVREHLDELNDIREKIENEQLYLKRAESEVATIFEEVSAGSTDPVAGLKKAKEVEERLHEGVSKCEKNAFSVSCLDKNGSPIEPQDNSTKPCDIMIHVESAPVSDEKAKFKVEIDRTLTVINQVFGDEKGRDKAANYIDGLQGICHVGLEHQEPTHLKLANMSLESFRDEFVTREAGPVKNRYLWRLAGPCLVVSVFASLAYVLALSLKDMGWLSDGATFYRFRNLFLLVAGAGVGTWVSFLLRREILSFLDLAALEQDRLDPTIRVLFVAALTSVVGLLLWAGGLSLKVGQFSTDDLRNSGVTALLIGLLLGIAERSMATAVQKRATEFGTAVGET